MNMPERVPVVELQREQNYYLAGQGIYQFVGEMGRGLKGHPEEKQFRNAKAVFRFKPHHEYSAGKEKLVAIEAISQGNKVHQIPSRSQLEAAFAIVRGNPERLEHNTDYKLNAGGVIALAEVIRDTKRMPHEKLHQEGRMALAYLLAYHMQSALGEARDYVDFLASSRVPWPEGVPHMPRSRDVMNRVASRFKNDEVFTPSFIEGLARDLSPVARTLTPVAAPAAVSLVKVPAPLAAPAAAPSSSAASESPHKRDRVKAFNPALYERAAVFTRDGKLYQQIAAELTGQEGMMAIVDAAVDIGMIQKDVIYLTRAIFTKEKLAMTNVVLSKNHDNAPDEPEWTLERARAYYHTMIDELLQAVPDASRTAAQAAAEVLYSHVDIKQRKAAPVVTALVASPAPDTAAAPVAPSVIVTAPAIAAAPTVQPPPAPVVDDTPPPVSLIPVAPAPVPVVDPDDEPYTDADRIVGQFSIAVRRRREEPLSPAVVRELQLAIKTPHDAPMALLAADRLSPIAFEIFSGVALQRKDMATVAEELGTSPDTVRRVFTMAAHVVRGATRTMLSSPARPSLEDIPAKTYG